MEAFSSFFWVDWCGKYGRKVNLSQKKIGSTCCFFSFVFTFFLSTARTFLFSPLCKWVCKWGAIFVLFFGDHHDELFVFFSILLLLSNTTVEWILFGSRVFFLNNNPPWHDALHGRQRCNLGISWRCTEREPLHPFTSDVESVRKCRVMERRWKIVSSFVFTATFWNATFALEGKRTKGFPFGASCSQLKSLEGINDFNDTSRLRCNGFVASFKCSFILKSEKKTLAPSVDGN